MGHPKGKAERKEITEVVQRKGWWLDLAGKWWSWDGGGICKTFRRQHRLRFGTGMAVRSESA